MTTITETKAVSRLPMKLTKGENEEIAEEICKDWHFGYNKGTVEIWRDNGLGLTFDFVLHVNGWSESDETGYYEDHVTWVSLSIIEPYWFDNEDEDEGGRDAHDLDEDSIQTEVENFLGCR